jgi:hypothetical protein
VPTVTVNNVSAGIRTRWAAVSALNALVPSTAVFLGRGAEKVSTTALVPPYARLVVTETSRELFSGSPYLAKFRVEVEAYTAAEPAVAGTVHEALNAAFNGTDSAPAAGITVPNATAVLGSIALPGAATRPTGERIDGKDVVRVSAAFEVMLQGSR